MKKIILAAAAIAVTVFTISSCSVEKRHYMKGYHIEWFGHDNKAPQHEQTAAPVKHSENTEAVAVVTNEDIQAPAQVAPAPAPAQQSFTPAAAAKAVKKAAAKTAEANQAVNTVKNAVVKQAVKNAAKSQKPASAPDKGLLIVLAILIPWLAVGLATDWDVKTVVINLLLCLTCIGGIIHAIIVVNKNA